MPNLHEYQAKKLLKAQGIPVPEGDVASTPKEARIIAESLSRPVVIKSQIWTTGRFKAGAIKFAANPHETENLAETLLGRKIRGLTVEKLLVEEQLAIEKELYVSIIVNDSYKVKAPVLMVATQGGVDIEDIAATSPYQLVRLNISLFDGLNLHDIRKSLSRFEIANSLRGQLSTIICSIYEVFRNWSARSVEVNPLVVTDNGELYAADCRMVIDEASVFRHPELAIEFPRDIGRSPTVLERIAWEIEKRDYRGIGYFVQMATDFGPGEGYVGFHGIGGGAAMLGADALIRHGLRLANYADTSGNPTASKVYRIGKLIFSQPHIDGYVLMGAVIANQDQWHHAHALVRLLREELVRRPNFPVVLLLAGNKEVESLEILREGLRGLSAAIELYGRDYVDNIDYVAERMKKLVDEYRRASKTKSMRRSGGV